MPKKVKKSFKRKKLGDSDEILSPSPPKKEKFFYPKKKEFIKPNSKKSDQSENNVLSGNENISHISNKEKNLLKGLSEEEIKLFTDNFKKYIIDETELDINSSDEFDNINKDNNNLDGINNNSEYQKKEIKETIDHIINL